MMIDQRSAGRDPPSAIPEVRVTRPSFSQRVKILGAVDLPIPAAVDSVAAVLPGLASLPQFLLGIGARLRRVGDSPQRRCGIGGHDYLAASDVWCGGHAPAGAGAAPGAHPVVPGRTTMDASLPREVKRNVETIYPSPVDG